MELEKTTAAQPVIDSKIPEGPVAEKWTNYKAHQRLVNPANKRKLDIIVVGTGLAGASAAATLGELGFNVLNFCIQDSPRRAHSIAAQGGINAAKNYQNDGDSVYRLFYDTVKGGDYRSREANVYRLAEVSNNIIDQCVAQGVPFAREYGGLLANRSFGGAQVSRTFYAKGQTGQQLLLGAYSALMRQVNKGTVEMYTRHEMLDVVLVTRRLRARGIIVRNIVTGAIERYSAHTVVIGTGGYGNTYFLSTNAMSCNGSAALQCYHKGAWFANPCYAQIHPTCIPVHGDIQSKLTLMSESLRNDGRIWVPKKLEDAQRLQRGEIKGNRHSRGRPRLLSGAPLSGLRQPRAPRRGQPCRQGALRQGLRCQLHRQGRLPRLLRGHPASRQAGCGRPLRQPLPDVEEITDDHPTSSPTDNGCITTP